MALGGMMLARDFNRAFHRLRAGIGEEHEVGKALLAQPRREPLAVRALEQVRHVPEFCRLLLQGGDQRWVRVTERVDRDAGGEVEIALAIGCDQPSALAALEGEIDPGEYGEQMRCGAVGHDDHLRVATRHDAHCLRRINDQVRKTKRAAF